MVKSQYIIPEYRIELLNKSKKIIDKIEHIKQIKNVNSQNEKYLKIQRIDKKNQKNVIKSQK